MKYLPVAVAALLTLTACGKQGETQEEIEACVGDFAEKYCNYELHEALKLCTPESRKWIAYTASNITDDDLAILRAQDEGAVADVTDIEQSDSDSSAMATVVVSNFMFADSIGKPGRMVDEGTFLLPVVRRNGRWLVNLQSVVKPQ